MIIIIIIIEEMFINQEEDNIIMLIYLLETHNKNHQRENVSTYPFIDIFIVITKYYHLNASRNDNLIDKKDYTSHYAKK